MPDPTPTATTSKSYGRLGRLAARAGIDLSEFPDDANERRALRRALRGLNKNPFVEDATTCGVPTGKLDPHRGPFRS